MAIITTMDGIIWWIVSKEFHWITGTFIHCNFTNNKNLTLIYKPFYFGETIHEIREMMEQMNPIYIKKY